MDAQFHTSSDRIFLYHQRLSVYKWLRHGFSLRKYQQGAVMTGWRGTLQRIASKAVHLMQTNFGSNPSHCLAVMGPAIRRCCYEVGEEVVEAFSKEFERSASFFSEPPSGRATRPNSQCVD